MKKEKKNGKRLKTWLIVFAVFIVIGMIGTFFEGDNKKDVEDDTQISEQAESNSVEKHEEKQSDQDEINTSLPEPSSDSAEEPEETNEDPLGFNVMFSDTYRNDVTGNWRLARIAEDINIEEYALDYYKNYFQSDDEIHIVINFVLNTTTKISVLGNLLDVTIMEYVDKEEHDAKIACSGTLLSEYHINMENGEIEKIQ
ncbi:MAG: hypothetical protein HFI31_07930 [Lachnospiraceae bacterium]|nr:hypothetical protein [Lachnospiraceae bacterium]